ncbi:hypothetical protein niasHT_002879 [Heterodera trifolii]|uniref:Uncharacterized protein n=1 Tax=Heterodera trifolii TaxID=157864 RepID=A0ABD2M5N5_9BILA
MNNADTTKAWSANGSQPIERGGANTKSYADDSAQVTAIVPFKRNALCQMLGQIMPAKSVPNPECRWLGTYFTPSQYQALAWR